MFLRTYFLQKSETTYDKSLYCCEATMFLCEGRRGRDHIVVGFSTEINNVFSCDLQDSPFVKKKSSWYTMISLLFTI